MSPEKIYRAMTTGAIQAMAQNLTDQQKIAIAESLTGRRFTEGDTTSAAVMKNRCTSNPLLGDTQSGPSGMMEPSFATRGCNRRNAKLSPAKFQHEFCGLWCPGATSMYNEPTVVGGRLYTVLIPGKCIRSTPRPKIEAFGRFRRRRREKRDLDW
jgi:hypothetical protein